MMVRRALGGVLLIALVIVGGGALYLLSSLPQLDGRIAVGGPTHSIHIARDTDGVPLIDAANDEDADKVARSGPAVAERVECCDAGTKQRRAFDRR